MSNSMYEQYGYKSARDLMTDLARDISDGDMIRIIRLTPETIMYGYRFDGGYWSIIYHHQNRCWRVASIDYHDTEEELNSLMEAMSW